MCPKTCSLLEDFVTQRTLTKCGPKCAPWWRTLPHSRLQPNVPQNVFLVGGLCHAADFDQMWPKMCPLLEDFVTQQTLTKYGSKCNPCWRTLSCSKRRPNVAQNVDYFLGRETDRRRFQRISVRMPLYYSNHCALVTIIYAEGGGGVEAVTKADATIPPLPSLGPQGAA
jgi:hypothetical protein